MTETLAYLRERMTIRPRVAMILGSGLGALADELEDAVRLPFAGIPGFAPATVGGHKGVLVAGRLEGVECVVLQGRCHVYEGHRPETVALPVRAVAALGARTLIVTNAAGGLSRAVRPGDVMIIDDHINLLWRHPLIGPVMPGDERFPDMSCPYDPELQALAGRVALELGIRAPHGVYCAVSGPSYETPAEIRMLQFLGGDAVGMSTVPEVLVARAMGMRVLGISLITNRAAGLVPGPLSHERVVTAAEEAGGRVSVLIRRIIRELGEAPDVEVA